MQIVGAEIEEEDFTAEDFQTFDERLATGLDALRAIVGEPGFGEGETTIGAELELNLVDALAQPLFLNRHVLPLTDDRRMAVELDRFNLECNARPMRLAGHPFAMLERELESALLELGRAAAPLGGRVVAIGILPTLLAEHLRPDALTDSPRYRALSRGLRAMRRTPFKARIDGEEPITFTCDDVQMVGANTSFQVHLRVRPQDFARTYNAAQMAIAPVLAASGNSPLFLGRCLWQETRIALFKQGTDARGAAPGGHDDDTWRRPARVGYGHGWVREGVVELFEESVRLHAPLLPVVSDEDPHAVLALGGMPALAELRLHHGTVYPWNRAIFDPANGGHLRVELRALPAGPSILDMVANAAFALGLTLGLAPRIDALLAGLPFGLAEWSFYRAAKQGLDAELLWPTTRGVSPEVVSARELVVRLAPLAREGLLSGGVDPTEADRMIDVFVGRAETGRTGARWQRAALAKLEADMPRSEALAAMVERYMEHAASKLPVHEWPIP
jgi:hypothetical protein